MMRILSRVAVARTLGSVLFLVSCALPWGAWSCAAAPAPDSAASPVTITFDSLLSFARGGGFDYRRAHAVLSGSAAKGEQASRFAIDWQADSLPTDAALARAFWIDAYNGSAIVGVLNHYPTPSVSAIPDYFTGRRYEFFGEQLSLDDIEKKKLLGASPDARIHFAIVCASRGCPPLFERSFRKAVAGDSILDFLTAEAINDTAYVKVDFASGKAQLSRLFDWYRRDFETAAGSLPEFLARYHDRREDMLRRAWTIQFGEYDWSLNQVPATSR
jgi:hypothetical protein